MTGVVDLTTALPSSLWVVTCTCTPGFEESWFSVGGRAGGGDAMVIWEVGYMSTIVDKGVEVVPADTVSFYLDISVGNTGNRYGA